MANILTNERAKDLIAKGDYESLIVETSFSFGKKIVTSAINTMGAFSISHADREELLGITNLVIVESATKYNPTKGVDWNKYIYVMGKYACMRYLSESYKYNTITTTSFINDDGEVDDILEHIADTRNEKPLSLFDIESILTKDEYEIISSIYIEGFTVKETAKKLNCSTDVISITRERAKCKIKKNI